MICRNRNSACWLSSCLQMISSCTVRKIIPASYNACHIFLISCTSVVCNNHARLLFWLPSELFLFDFSFQSAPSLPENKNWAFKIDDKTTKKYNRLVNIKPGLIGRVFIKAFEKGFLALVCKFQFFWFCRLK